MRSRTVIAVANDYVTWQRSDTTPPPCADVEGRDDPPISVLRRVLVT
jgi:hypothetical protein